MQKCVVAIFVFCLFEIVSSFSTTRLVDPFSYALEQFLSEITFEIVPYPAYPNVYPACDYMTYPPIPYCYEGISYGKCDASPYDFRDRVLQCPPSYLDFPCEFDSFPCCTYRDIREPCIICDNPSSLCICFDGFNCIQPDPCFYFPPVEYPMSLMGMGCEPSPYLYYPTLEYPMSTLDTRPFYYGYGWCT